MKKKMVVAIKIDADLNADMNDTARKRNIVVSEYKRQCLLIGHAALKNSASS